MRAGMIAAWGAVSLATALVGLSAPAVAQAAPASSTACGTACSVPSCWEPEVRARPGLRVATRVSCTELSAIRLLTAPPQIEISALRADWDGFHFDLSATRDAPRYNEAVFELTGYDGATYLQRVSVEVVPLSENSPPVCRGDELIRRSDGTGPVSVMLHPYCRDPDGDQFDIYGGPPGVHFASPKTVPAGESDSNWWYQTATFSGTEATTIWAVDVLGARSEDARLEVTIGPEINAMPECGPTSWSSGRDNYAIYSRPGVPRRFPLICEDADADPVDARVSTPPTRGTMVVFEQEEPSYGYMGTTRWIDATYVPTLPTLDQDVFEVTPAGPHGDGPATRFRIIPRPLPQNGGGSCGWGGGGGIEVDTPGQVVVSCYDDDGDALTAEVVTEPRHGTVATSVSTPGKYGYTDMTIPYVPDPGYLGYDCVVIKVTDGNGLEMEIAVDIWVQERPPPMTPPPFEPPPIPILPIDIGTKPKQLAMNALGTTAVKRVARDALGEVWARVQLSRDDLERYGAAPGMVVICNASCEVRSGSRLKADAARGLRRSGQHRVMTTPTGGVQVLSLAVRRAQLRALRRAQNPRGAFRVAVKSAGQRRSTVNRSIPISP